MYTFDVFACYIFLALLFYNLERIEAKCPSSSANKTCRQGSQICPACIDISWLDRPPFSFQATNVTEGILPEFSDSREIGWHENVIEMPAPSSRLPKYALLRLMLSKCCGNYSLNCWEVIYEPPETDAEQLLRKARDSQVIFPVIVDKQEATNENLNIISLVPPASLAFVVPKGKRESYPKKLLMSVFEAWPVLILTILLSILAGVFLWLLDTWFNEKEFPREFFRGSWEGFWWAFVSMTTVGYGDRAPISVLGRTFAVAWILIGICICSIFTATLTTSLTTISLDTKKGLPGSKVGVLKRSIELAIGMQQQADVKLYNSVKEMRQALDKGDIEGVLLDNYQISHYTDSLFPNSEFKTDQILKEDTLSYGAVVNDSHLLECFRNLIAEDKYLLYDFTRKELTKTLKGGGDEAVQNSQSIFDPTGDLFFPSLYTCLALVAVIFLVGLLAELFYFRPSRCSWKIGGRKLTESIPMSQPEEKTPLDQLEKEMISEVQALFNKYREKLEQYKNAENNGNALSMHSTV